MRIPLLDLKRQHQPLESAFTEAFVKILHSCAYILGPEVEQLEKEVASFCDVKHALAVSSGTDALLVALLTLNIQAGDEVILPAFTFFATASTVARLGAIPVFADVDPETFNLLPESIEALITPKTKAIIPVHLFGQSAEMAPILELASQHHLNIIEDAAQALGAHHHGKAVGTFGDIGTFSFYPTKNLGALGDAGMLVTNDDKLAHKAKMLRNHGSDRRYYHTYLGGNFRCDGIQAALLRVKFPHFPHYNRSRQKNAALYTSALREFPDVVESLSAISSDSKLLLPKVLPHNDHIWNQYTLRVLGSGNRESLKAHLAAHDVASEIYYPLSLDAQECFQHLPPSRDRLQTTYRLTEEVLSIPNFPELTEEEIHYVIESIREWLK